MLNWRLVPVLPVLTLQGCVAFDLPTEPVRPCAEAAEWRISGFDGTDVVSGGAAAAAIRMIVGQSRELHAAPVAGYNFTSCEAAIASVRWSSANSAVAAVGPGVQTIWLTAESEGETEVRAEVTLATGTVHAASLSVFHASSGQTVRTVRVFPVGPPPPGRTVVFSGTITLEPPGSGGPSQARLPFDVPNAGTLDMVVDWQTPTNRVIAHLCPGVVPENLGCVPVINGTFIWGEKPAIGTAQVAPGVYSFWISNNGPGAETVRYEAGLVAP